MDLAVVSRTVFEQDCPIDTIQKLCNDNKEQFLSEITEWMQNFLNSLNPEEEIPDKRPGRIGNVAVYFTLDRSFGVLAINQEGLNVISACRFATISASCGVFEGKWMYEFQLGSKGIMQIGWCTNKCQFTADRGCGDTVYSYAFDGSRVQAWNMLSFPYGEKWRNGDIIASCIDLDNKTISFYRNGKDLGIAFRNIVVGAQIIYLPCISLVESESICANFGAKPFKYPIENYEPLQEAPHSKINQAHHVLKWLKNITNIIEPLEPVILNCINDTDISDQKFWSRFVGSICYHVNKIICSRYCIFYNFLPFVCDIAHVNDTNFPEEKNLKKFNKIMTVFWLYIKDRYLDKCLQYILQHLYNNYRQVSESIDLTSKKKQLFILSTFVQHETTRKYIIKNLLFERVDILPFLTQSPLDEPYIKEFAGDSWWNNKEIVPHVEKNKKTFNKAFEKITKAYSDLEDIQCKLLEILMNNRDGTASTPSSRGLFLRKFRKFCWHELDCSRNDFVTKIQALVAYGAFLRLMKTLLSLWEQEVGSEQIYCPAKYFYDKTFIYSHCDRVGGLEPFLANIMHDQLVTELGPDHRIFRANNDSGFNFQVDEGHFSVVGSAQFQGFIEILDSNSMTDNNLPGVSTQPFLQALFLPMIREHNAESTNNNLDDKKSLIELFEDLVIFFVATIVRHCHKLARTCSAFNQYCTDYEDLHIKLRVNKNISSDPLTIAALENTYALLTEELEKRARRIAWIFNVIVTETIHQRFVTLLKAVAHTIVEAENKKDLFVFVPDFYLECCDSLVSVLVKDFVLIRPISEFPESESILSSIAEAMMVLTSDSRIKHIDCKKIPTNIIATLASTSRNMRLLENVSPLKQKQFVNKLLVNYTDRHWKGTNWILMRFWHGHGYAFRYSVLPHHILTEENLASAANYSVYNIAPGPSAHFQQLVRERLMDQAASIPDLLDSIISELHWCFGEFLAPLQELQRAIEKNEQLMMFGSLYKMCSSFFNKTISLLRILDMFISLAPEVFIDSYYIESNSLTKRIIQIILLIIHRISSKQGCFRTVMNSRIAVLENIDYLPIISATIAIILGILSREMDDFRETDMSVPIFSRMVLTDPSYDIANLKCIIGSPETKNSTVMCLHDYETEVTPDELGKSLKLLKMLEYYAPRLSAIKLIPEDELCIICCSAPKEVKFIPCGHNSCLACITYYIAKNRLCFFCKRMIFKVAKMSNDEIIPELTANITEDDI